MPKALDGVTVVEFGGNLAAAYAAWLMAEQGARTIKVEPPQGDPTRGTPHFHVVNRSKRSVVLDLEAAAGRSHAADLIAVADVVISGFVPSRQRALGLDYPSVSRVNPAALMLTMPPLGSRGPMAEIDAGSDLAEALGGIAANQWARSGNPVAMAFPLAAYETGVLGATAAVAGLVSRAEDGAGQEIEVSMLAGAMAMQTGGILRNPQMVRPHGNGPEDPLGNWAIYRILEAGDGKYLFVAAGNPRFWHRLAIAVERPELISDPRFEDAPFILNRENGEALKRIMIDIFRQKPRDEWLELLAANEIPCAKLVTRQECFFQDPQVRHLGMHREVLDPVLGPTEQIGVPIKLDLTPGDLVGPAPTLAQDAALLSELSEQARRKKAQPLPPASASKKGPLAGLLVLDFGGYIAGSYGPMLLAQMGAEVIKIESLEGDPFRLIGYGFMGWNQGKRGIALDLRKPEAREIAYALVRKADVMVENLRPGRSAALGIDYPTIAAINPRIVYMTVTGFGSDGPAHDRPGFDPLTQALSGVMMAHNGEGRSEPGPHHPLYLTCPVSDYGAGSFSALGCVLALYARERMGAGQHCETTLIQSVMALQAGEFVFYPGRPNLENGAPELRGLSALHRAYQCRDGKWIYLAVAQAATWEKLRAATPGLPPLGYEEAARQGPESGLAKMLGDYCGRLTASEALTALSALGAPAAPANRLAELFADPQAAANGLLTELVHSKSGLVGQVAALMKFSRTQAEIHRASPLLGEHGDEILREYLGYDQARIAGLRQAGVLR